LSPPAQAGHCFDADGEKAGCQKADGSLSAPPPYGDTASLGAGSSPCGYYFVFDLTDDKQSGSTLSLPGANVYDCSAVTTCDVRGGGWSGSGSYQDFALATITAAGEGTWTDDTGTTFTFPTRTALGDRSSIAAATLNGAALAAGTAITVIGHPSGLPRKYTGGATVATISTCIASDTRCPTADAKADVAFAGYVADLDTFVSTHVHNCCLSSVFFLLPRRQCQCVVSVLSS
jgi:hypothetical protein